MVIGNVNDNVSGGGGFAPPPLTTQQILPSKRVVGEGLWITSLGERCWRKTMVVKTVVVGCRRLSKGI